MIYDICIIILCHVNILYHIYRHILNNMQVGIKQSFRPVGGASLGELAGLLPKKLQLSSAGSPGRTCRRFRFELRMGMDGWTGFTVETC